MKVGIITIHAAHNYGSVLQAYALEEKIKQMGHSVQIINYRPNYLECQYKMFSTKVYKRYKGIPSKIIHLGWRTLKFGSRYKKYKSFEKYIANRYNLTDRYKNYAQLQKANFDFDAIFCGSDQIWNTDITEGFDKSYYIGFADKPVIKAAYAASLAKKDIDHKYEDEYKEYIPKFDHIALREESSQPIIQSFTEKEVQVVVDPTLLLKKEQWDKIADGSTFKNNGKYIFVYILEENEEMVKIVNAISDYLNVDVISPSKKKRFKREKIYPEMGPEDFVKLIKNSEFVITNSFHGTVFSLIYEKRNCIIPHKNKGNRMIDLMTKVGLKDRIINKYEELDIQNIIKDVDYEKVNKIIDKEIEKAENYIRNVLK